MRGVKVVTATMPQTKTCIFMIPPAAREVDLYYPDVAAEFIVHGTDEERKTYAEHMNLELEKRCAENGFYFISAYNEYTDAEGFLDSEKSDGICHMKFEKPIERVVRHLLLGE